MYNVTGNCGCICIVRGGGDPEDLIVFSHPKVVEAIYNSKIPVISGIGHKDDKFLCDEVVYYNGDTPTGAANKINNIIWKESNTEKIDTRKKQKSINWKEQYHELEKKYKELEQKLNEYKQIEQNKEETNGIWKKILKFFR